MISRLIAACAALRIPVPAIKQTPAVMRGAALSQQIADFPLGICSGTTSSNGAGTAGTVFFRKRALPVKDYTQIAAVQLVIQVPYNASSYQTTYAALLAATETAEIDTGTWSKTHNPWVSGAAVNTIDATDNTGWFTVKWGGASSLATGSSVTATQPAVPTSADNPGFIVSDVMPFAAIARSVSDPSIGSYTAWPLAMLRISALNTNTDGAHDSAHNVRALQYNAGAIAATANNRGLLLQTHRHATTGAAVTNYMTNPGSYYPGISPTGGELACGLILHLKTGGICWVGFGDSTTEANAINDSELSGVDSWCSHAAALIAESGTPCGWVNRGRSSGASSTYDDNLANALASFKPNLVSFQGFSHNDGPMNTAATMRSVTALIGARTAEAKRQAEAVGARFLMTTGFPEAIGVIPDAVDPVRRTYMNTWKNANTRADAVIDTCASVSDGGTPERWVAADAYDYGDDIHPKSTGARKIGVDAAQVIRRVFGV